MNKVSTVWPKLTKPLMVLHFTRSKKGPREEEVQEEEQEEIIDSEEEEEVAEDFEDEDLEYIKQSGAKFLSGVEDR